LRDNKVGSRRGKISEDDEGEDRKDGGSGEYKPTTPRSKAKGGEARGVEMRGRGVVEDEWAHGAFIIVPHVARDQRQAPHGDQFL